MDSNRHVDLRQDRVGDMTVTDLDGIAGGAMGAGRHRQTRDKVKTLTDRFPMYSYM